MDGCTFSLYSAGNWIGDEGVKVIGRALESNNTLTSLNLSGKEWMVVDSHYAGNKIGDEGAKVIGRALESNNTLISLNLSGKEWMVVYSHSILQTIRLVMKVSK